MEKTKTIELKEMVVDDMDFTIRSVINFENKNGTWEVYRTGDNGSGICIQITESGENVFHTTKKKAQAVCDAYNKTNHVYEKIAEYEMASE